MRVYASPDGEKRTAIDSIDAFYIKCLALTLSKALRHKLSKRCVHLKDHGGSKQCISSIKRRLKHYKYAFKSDIKSYYQSMRHDILLTQLERLLPDPAFCRAIRMVVEQVQYINGVPHHLTRGITTGSALSPLLGGVMLDKLDKRFENRPGILYVRYQDDWLILTKSRKTLQRVIRQTRQVLKQLDLTMHPDKTSIGKIEKGFDFLGYHFTPTKLSTSVNTIKKAAAKA